MSGYDPFWMIDSLLEEEYISDKEHEAERFRAMNDNEFFIEVKKVNLEDLKILSELAYRWHDENLISNIKSEFKRRGVILWT